MIIDVRRIVSILLLAGLLSACGDGILRVGSGDAGDSPESEPITSGEEPDDGDSAGTEEGFGPIECAETEAFCQGACLDVASNPNHCGTCGNVCESGQCDGGACVGDDSTDGSGDGTSGDGSSGDGSSGDGSGGDGTGDGGSGDGSGDGSSGDGTGDGSGGSNNTPPEVGGVLAETNDARENGANCGAYGQYAPTEPLQLDPDLNEAAQAHADDMALNSFFSHTGSDGSSFVVRIGRTDFSGQPIGENIAAGQQSPAQAVSGWVDSDGHCRNLMNPQATKMGVGYAMGGPYGTLWVQVFGR